MTLRLPPLATGMLLPSMGTTDQLVMVDHAARAPSHRKQTQASSVEELAA